MVFDITTVKSHLRIEHELEDALISGYMEAAQDYAETFLGCKLADFETLPGTIQAGLLLHTALFYESRQGEFFNQTLKSIERLYWPHRKVSL